VRLLSSSRNQISAVNLLISGGIEPVNFLLPRPLLSQDGARLLHKQQRATQVRVLHVLNFRRRAYLPRKHIIMKMACRKLTPRTADNETHRHAGETRQTRMYSQLKQRGKFVYLRRNRARHFVVWQLSVESKYSTLNS
jgi:hypothetical protein